MRFFTNTVICKQNYRLLSEIVSFIARTFPSVAQIKLTYPRLQSRAADNLSKLLRRYGRLHLLFEPRSTRPRNWGRISKPSSCPFACWVRHTTGPITSTEHESICRTFIRSDPDYVRPLGDIFYEACEACDLRNQCFGIDTLHHEAFGENPCFKPVSFADFAHSEAG